MKRLLLTIACLTALGCGSPPAPPTLDAAGEKEYEQQQKQAAAAEGKQKKERAGE